MTPHPIWSFAEAGKEWIRGGEYGPVLYKRRPGRIRVRADGERRWRTYRLVETICRVHCCHCERTMDAGEAAIRFGRCGWFVCCLQCIEWREDEA